VLSVDEAAGQIRRRCERDWVLWALGRGSWPFKLPLGAPRGVEFDQNLAAAQLWSAAWHAPRRGGAPGTVLTEPRRARGLGTHAIPTSWVFDGPLDALALNPDLKPRYVRACDRFEAAVGMSEVVWGSVSGIPLGEARKIAEFSDDDWRIATAVVTLIAAGRGDEALMVRKLAVAGMHSKWIENNAGVIGAMVGVPPGEGTPLARLESHIGLMAEKQSLPVYLACPQLREAAAGMSHFSATASALNASSLNPRVLVIIENRKFGNTLDFTADGVAVVYGLGGAATLVADTRWAGTAQTVLYWGDIDRKGLSILASLRRAGVDARSILMDKETWDRYPNSQHESQRDQGLSDVAVPEELDDSERALYELLNAEHRSSGVELQLEQEHIPSADWLAAIADLVGSPTATNPASMSDAGNASPN